MAYGPLTTGAGGITQANLDNHISNKDNPHGVTAKQIGAQPTITGGATTIASSDLTASRALVSDSNGKVVVSEITSTELEYLAGVTSAIQTQLDDKAASSHGTHVTYSATTPLVAGVASVGSANTVARSDHIHPAQTSVSGNAGSATKLATARTIQTNLASTSSASFNGTANVTPGVTGTLPVANGGTGATKVADARTNLDVYSKTETDAKISTAIETAIVGAIGGSY